MYKIIFLINTCQNLDMKEIPFDCLSDDGTSRTGHYSGTLEAMEEALGMPLTWLEKEVLALSRCYGKHQKEELMKQLWPNGNSSGYYLSWKELRAEIIATKMWRNICSQV